MTVVRTQIDEGVVFDDSGTPPEQGASTRFMLGDTSGGPLFVVSDVSRIFFARSDHWLRWRERQGKFELDGQPLIPERNESGFRKYTLSDIEKMAHALASQGKISGERLQQVLATVKAVAVIHGYPIAPVGDTLSSPDLLSSVGLAGVIGSRLAGVGVSVGQTEYLLSAEARGDRVDVAANEVKTGRTYRTFTLSVFAEE